MNYQSDSQILLVSPHKISFLRVEQNYSDGLVMDGINSLPGFKICAINYYFSPLTK